jgi:hypothetical protein
MVVLDHLQADLEAARYEMKTRASAASEPSVVVSPSQAAS